MSPMLTTLGRETSTRDAKETGPEKKQITIRKMDRRRSGKEEGEEERRCKRREERCGRPGRGEPAPPNWYLNTRTEQNCCYHKKLMN